MSDQKQMVKEWYDGFTFGDMSDIYNPWSIINYLDKGRVGAYWANTSSNSLVRKLIKEVRIMFGNMIRDWFAEHEDDYNDFIKALLTDNIKAMNRYMNEVALETFSFFDTGKRASGKTEYACIYQGVHPCASQRNFGNSKYW